MAGSLAAQLYKKADMMEEEEGALKTPSLKKRRIEQINNDVYLPMKIMIMIVNMMTMRMKRDTHLLLMRAKSLKDAES